MAFWKKLGSLKVNFNYFFTTTKDAGRLYSTHDRS
jgi:hypothetical protein